MKHRTNVRRAFIVNNEFTENSGLIESSVIFIRAHAPLERGSVYTRVPYDTGNSLITPLGTVTATADSEPDTQYYCSGYHFESNIFQKNMACTVYGGAMIKFECVSYNEVSSAGNDIISSTPLTSTTLASYKKINFANHQVRAETTNLAVWGTLTIPVDLNINTFKNNQYLFNYGSNGMGLIDIKGAPRISFSGETFEKNGDAVREVKDKYPL